MSNFFKKAGAAYVDALKHPEKTRAVAKEAVIAAFKPAPVSTVIQVKEYKNAKDFQKDAAKMLGAGWTIAGQTTLGGRVFKNARITVTYLPPAGGEV